MRVSLNTIKEYVHVDCTVDELVQRINQQLGGVEEVIDLGARYEGATIVRIDSCEKHPNADKLSVCMVDDGSGELTQVVCGAPNVKAGAFAVWLKPGMTVPSTAQDSDPFVLGSRELRGVVSHGMLAAGDELALNSDHDGIVILTEKDVPEGKKLSAGSNFAEMFGLDDTLIDIENKMFTHRPDLFGQLGIAREIAGIQGHEFEEPEWYLNEPIFNYVDTLELELFNDASDNVQRLMAVAMNDVTVSPSPIWLQATLVRWGGKPINNVVDLTNYVMLLTAQPTHAYDYDKISGQKLGARMANQGEEIMLLNGKRYTLDTNDIVMADAERAVGLAGIMGSGESEVDESTTRIVLEVATFDMYAVRKSAMRHGIFTDALTRFNKGQSPLQNNRIIAKLIDLMRQQSGAKQASDVLDNNRVKPSSIDTGSMSESLVIPVDFINSRLGLDLDGMTISSLLRNVHFDCYPEEDGELNIRAPFWRTDIELPEDIVEEVGRLYGFENLPRELPPRSAKPAPVNQKLRLKRKIREIMKSLGANEVLTYSFVHEKVLVRSGQNVSDAFKLTNALSPDLQYYRLSLMPSLLDKVHMNIKAGHDAFVLYELGKGHNKNDYEEDLPAETDLLEMVYASKQIGQGAAFYQMRRIVEQLASDLGVSVEVTPLTDKMADMGQVMYNPSRTALVRSGEQILGLVGEFERSVTKNFKLPSYSAGASLRLSALQASAMPTSQYQPLSRYPSVSQDISLKVAESVTYGDLYKLALDVTKGYSSDLAIKISPISIYQPPSEQKKTVTFRFVVTSYEKTLTDNEVSKMLEKYAERAKLECSASVV
ncbi:MAG: phenylalanine--tRNA ligase subunit beta [Candidatus Saccharimonadales bacterium]